MSLILDALRKSERTRQQTLTGQLSASDAVPRRAHIPVPWATLIGILLVANALVLAIIFWHTHARLCCHYCCHPHTGQSDLHGDGRPGVSTRHTLVSCRSGR